MEKEHGSILPATTPRTVSKLNAEDILVQSAIIPKTGARIRDDFKPKMPSTVSEVENKDPITAVYLPDLLEGEVCRKEVSRGVVWQASVPGSLLSTSCPNDASGLAIRECKLDGWSRPQLGQCTAFWLSSLTSSYTSHALNPRQLSTRLRQEMANKELFGGDIIGVLDLAERLIKNGQFDREGGDRDESLNEQNLAHSLSSLLDRRTLPAWLDLSQIELEFQRSRFINLLTELGLVALHNQRLERDLNADNLGGLP